MDQQLPTTDNPQNIVGQNIETGLTRLADKLSGAVGFYANSIINNAIKNEYERAGLVAPIEGANGELTYEQTKAPPCTLCKFGGIGALLAVALLAFLALR